MEYRKDLSNEQYLSNFKCCKNCPHWQVDHSLQGDYAYNGCGYWAERKLQFLIPWAAFCEGYAGGKTNEGPFHKLILSNDGGKLIFEKSEGGTL